MATVKILYTDTADHLESYLKAHEKQQKEKGKEVLLTEHSCFLDGLKTEFTQVQTQFHSKGNGAIHLIQSWSPIESQQLTPEKIHKMGIEIANRFARGHQFVVQTHTDQPHFHNHIVINPVHLETGKRIQNKYKNLHHLRQMNDTIAKEHGLSVLPPQEKLRRSGPSEKARRIEAYRGRSYIIDLAKKAEFARSYSRNFDEYLAILGGFNIRARIENENITYFYPGRNVGKRGRNLGRELDKPGLIEKFTSNQEQLKRSPEFQRKLAILTEKDKLKPNPSIQELLTQPNESKKSEFRSETFNKSFIPIEEIQNAKLQSILKYCVKEKIPVTQAPDGRTVLKNREYVELSDYHWINHKNKTRGTVIDFVANHRSTSLLHAVSIINDNPNLMLLERYLQTSEIKYQSFQIPKEDSASKAESILHLSSFLQSNGKANSLESLLKTQRVQVTQSGGIRFFPQRNPTGYLEYLPQKGKYSQGIVVGQIHSPFLYYPGKGQNLKLYLGPKALLQHRPDIFQQNPKSIEAVLSLLEPNLRVAHEAIARQKGLKHVQVVCETSQMETAETKKFYEELNESLDPFSIDAVLISAREISLSHALTSERVQSHSLDLTQ